MFSASLGVHAASQAPALSMFVPDCADGIARLGSSHLFRCMAFEHLGEYVLSELLRWIGTDVDVPSAVSLPPSFCIVSKYFERVFFSHMGEHMHRHTAQSFKWEYHEGRATIIALFDKKEDGTLATHVQLATKLVIASSYACANECLFNVLFLESPLNTCNYRSIWHFLQQGSEYFGIPKGMTLPNFIRVVENFCDHVRDLYLPDEYGRGRSGKRQMVLLQSQFFVLHVKFLTIQWHQDKKIINDHSFSIWDVFLEECVPPCFKSSSRERAWSMLKNYQMPRTKCHVAPGVAERSMASLSLESQSVLICNLRFHFDRKCKEIEDESKVPNEDKKTKIWGGIQFENYLQGFCQIQTPPFTGILLSKEGNPRHRSDIIEDIVKEIHRREGVFKLCNGVPEDWSRTPGKP